MIKTIKEETFPIFILEIGKTETKAKSLDEIASHFRAAIDAHPSARFIGDFDHYGHTRSLPDGVIAPEICDARNIVFCFGMAIPHAYVLATRPRSIGIAELNDRYVITFLEAPMPLVNAAMERWACNLIAEKKPETDAAEALN